MAIDVNKILTDAGYTYDGKNEAGSRYHNGNYTVYHSGHMLFFRREGGTIRPFREDRLEHFTVADMERQTNIVPKGFIGKGVDGEEDKVNYDFPTKRRP